MNSLNDGCILVKKTLKGKQRYRDAAKPLSIQGVTRWSDVEFGGGVNYFGGRTQSRSNAGLEPFTAKGSRE